MTRLLDIFDPPEIDALHPGSCFERPIGGLVDAGLVSRDTGDMRTVYSVLIHAWKRAAWLAGASKTEIGRAAHQMVCADPEVMAAFNAADMRMASDLPDHKAQQEWGPN